MSGAPSQMDLWDYKPGLANLYDKDLPESVRGNQALTGMTSGQARFPIAPSHWGFSRQGKSGRWVSDLLPWTGRLVDDLTLVHSHADGRHQSRASDSVDEHGQHGAGQAIDGRLAFLWARQHE